MAFAEVVHYSRENTPELFWLAVRYTVLCETVKMFICFLHRYKRATLKELPLLENRSVTSGMASTDP